MSESASSSYVYREAVEEEGESASSQYAISAIQGADWNISEEQQGQGQAEEGDYYYNGGDGYEEGRLTANGEDYWNSPEGQAAAAAYYQQYYSYSSSMEEHERESGAGEANNSQQRMTTVPGYSSTTTTTTTTIPSMASTAKTSISAAAKATSSFASSSAAAVVASNDGGVPYPAGYTPSASHSVSIVMKQQHSHLNSSQISSLNAPSVSSAPTTTTPTTSSSSSTSTYYTPAQPNYSSLAAHPYDPQNTSSSSSTTSKRKKTIRTAGGEVWQDDTLDEWDQSKKKSLLFPGFVDFF